MTGSVKANHICTHVAFLRVRLWAVGNFQTTVDFNVLGKVEFVETALYVQTYSRKSQGCLLREDFP